MSLRLARPAVAAARGTVPRTAFRGYAAAASADPKPPVPLFGIDGTYASALYTAAAKTTALESVSKALASLNQVLKSDSKLPAILYAPTLSARDKSQIVTELEKHTGGADKGGIVKNFLNTLAENNRLGILGAVCEDFEKLMSAHRGEIELIITSAAKLDDKVIKRIETAVAKSPYSQGKKLKVVTKITPDIIGGLIVEIGDRTIDYSVASKVSKMNKMLTDVV